MIIRLGQLGIEVENYYQSHRDIEWGFWNNNLYVFQSRPVTSGTNETVFEIDHEFDSPLRTENDFFSVANVGEVMPGAMSPLGMDYIFRLFSIVFNTEEVVWVAACRSHYFRSGWMTFYNHSIFNISDIFPDLKSEKLDYFLQASLIAFFGRIIKEEELTQVTRERYGDTKKASVLGLVKNLLTINKRIQKTRKAYANYRIPVEKFKTSRELFDHLLRSCAEMCSVCMVHMKSTQASSLWNMFILTILAKARGGFNDEVYRDFASLITTSSDVESADVPSAIQSLAFYISKAIDVNEFKKMSVEEALNWLQTTTCTAGRKFQEFLEKHGHRCLGEFDIYAIPWGSDPKSLVKLLQNLAGNVSQDFSKKHSDNINEMLSRLSIPLGFFSRLMLKVLLPMSRRGVQNRELTKSMCIKAIDEWRKAFLYLAKLLVLEGHIPEDDILFFMTMDEVKELLNTRSPKILARATQRQRRYAVLCKYIFPEIMKGVPRPMNLVEAPVVPTDENFMMKGIPVSQGVAEGFVRVAITLEEANLLKPKEILVTYSTDVGWTPYFPVLAGVVTELGGLISHG
ncbi:putative phosphoenolpyruvate synthase, partial [Stegodyphus mimosarum]